MFKPCTMDMFHILSANFIILVMTLYCNFVSYYGGLGNVHMDFLIS